MSAFSFNTAYQPTGDQQKDAIAQIDIMQNRAVQANLAYQSSLDAETLLKQLWQINDELGECWIAWKITRQLSEKKPVI
ncbi:hypothetical protein EC2730450_5163 [Escherichia coli 2730450]|nr:hypothetical protein EC2730450_5163 [Escherichia coli 2730450]